MIETHVLNTFLVGASRDTAWFGWLTYFDGIIAPAFLFIAGYVQGLGMRSGAAQPRAFGRRLRRLAEIWLLGYALHFPAPQLLAGQWTEAWRLGTHVDVLQCLAVSLALLLAIECWARRSVDTIVTVLILITVGATEIVADLAFQPDWLRAYFTPSTGSLFPLLPWAAFVFVGFLASRVTQWVSWKSAMLWILLVVFAVGAGGSNGFFAQRVAWLLLAVPLVQWVAARWQPQWLLFVGRESLVIYAAHLLLIEALAILALPRSSASIVICSVVFTGVLAASCAIAIAWRRTP